MIFSDLKPNTPTWDKNEVEVCFTSKWLLKKFKGKIDIITLFNGEDPLCIDTHDEDPKNMYIIIKLNKPNDVKIVQEAMERICNQFDCEILDY